MREVLSNGLLYAEIDGTRGAYDIGYQKGRLFSEEIKSFLLMHKANLARSGFGDSPDELVRRLTRESNYLKDMEKFLPAVFQEITGISEGSGVKQSDILLINFVEELFNLLLRSDESSPKVKGCSTGLLYGRAGQPNIAFMNADLFEYYTDFSVLYRVKYPEHTELSLSYVGCFGPLCGINSKGLCLIANSLLDGASRQGSGLTALAIESELLHCGSVEDAVQKLEGLPRSAGVSYLIMDRRSAANIEATAHDLRYVREPVAGLQVHTNHMLASTDFNPAVPIYDRWKALRCEDGQSVAGTIERYQILLSYLCGKVKNADAETAIEALRRSAFPHPSCYTNCSMVCICDPCNPYVLVSKGVCPNRVFVKINM